MSRPPRCNSATSAASASSHSLRSPEAASISSDEPTLTTMRRKSLSFGADMRSRLASAENFPVDDILLDQVAIEGAEDVLGGLQTHPVHRLARDACHVRRGDDVGELQQRIVLLRRLELEHVEAGACELAGGQRLVQRLLVDNAAARSIDQECGRLQVCQSLGVNMLIVAGDFGQWML